MLRPTVTTVALWLAAAPLAAQLPPLTVPRGHFRLDLTGSFLTADQRLRNGTTENLALDFVRAGAGSDLLGGLAAADEVLPRVTGVPGARLALGNTTASRMLTTGTGGIGLAWGVTDRLTVFGYLPIVRVKVRSTFGFDGEDALTGFNPADPVFGTGNGQVQTAQFFTQFDAALATLEQKITAGEYDGTPGLRTLAEETLASATALRGDLFTLLLGTGTASPFLPLSTSQLGTALLQRVTALQGTLSTSLAVDGFTQAPALPAFALTAEDFEGFLTNGQGPIAATLATPSLSSIGDIEVGAAWSIVDQLGTAGAVRGVRVAAQGLVRLRTGTLDSPTRLFDAGTGDRQPDVEGSVVGDVLFGSYGARAMAGYTLQLAGSEQRRIAPPDQPIAWADRLAGVSRNPGDILTIGVTPFVRLAETFALVGGAVWRRKGLDRVTLADGQPEIPGAPVDLLARETDGSWTTATVGLSYSTPATVRNGRPRLPLDAGLTWEAVVASSGDLRVVKHAGVRFWLRLYGRMP